MYANSYNVGLGDYGPELGGPKPKAKAKAPARAPASSARVKVKPAPLRRTTLKPSAKPRTSAAAASPVPGLLTPAAAPAPAPKKAKGLKKLSIKKVAKAAKKVTKPVAKVGKLAVGVVPGGGIVRAGLDSAKKATALVKKAGKATRAVKKLRTKQHALSEKARGLAQGAAAAGDAAEQLAQAGDKLGAKKLSRKARQLAQGARNAAGNANQAADDADRVGRAGVAALTAAVGTGVKELATPGGGMVPNPDPAAPPGSQVPAYTRPELDPVDPVAKATDKLSDPKTYMMLGAGALVLLMVMNRRGQSARRY